MRYLALLGLVFSILASLLSAQQPNSAGASLVANNQPGSGTLMVAQVESPGLAWLRVGGEPGSPFAVIIGTSGPGWDSLPGAGIVDLDLSQPLGKVCDGFSIASPLDFFAKTDAQDGEAMIAAAVASGLSGSGPAFQGLVFDPTSTIGVRFTGAARFDYVAAGGPSSAASSSSGSNGVSASGMAGATGGLISEIRAPLDAVGANDVTVLGSLLVGVDASTNVRDLNGSTIPLSALAAGDFVKVEFLVDQTTGDYLATQIRREIPRPGYDVKVEAVVNSSTANDVTVLGILFVSTPSSEIELPSGLVGLMAGDFVEVKANLVGGQYEIVEIHPDSPVNGAFDVSFRSRSFVDAVDAVAGTITVLGTTINVGNGVRFDNFGSLSQLGTSTYVEVRANPDTSGQLWASRIKVRSADNEVRVEGPAEALMNPNFEIFGVTVQTGPGTQWQNGLSSFADLTVGLRVQAKGTLSGGVVVASEVEIDPEND